MAELFATTSKGLPEVLEKELIQLGVKVKGKTVAGVFFEGSWEDCYRVNLKSRIASRIIKPVLDFPAYQGDELYHNIRKHDFTKYIPVHKTIKVEATVTDSKIKDQRFIAMKVKDAIVDQFRDKFGERPNVDSENPDLRIYVRAKDNVFSVAIDTTGDSLFMRGYRLEAGDAPLKENLAAALLAMAEWDGQSPIIDPMCGSGTILIEAAMQAMKLAPGSLRRKFGFMELNGFDKQAWEKVVNEAMEEELSDLPFKFYGYDMDRKVLQMAKQNARRAGVDHLIEFRPGNVATLKRPEGVERGVIITNPPYMIRLGDEDNVKDVYRDFAHSLKVEFKGWDAWILSGNKDLIGDLKLKSSRKFFVFNGPIECRFLKYSMR